MGLTPRSVNRPTCSIGSSERGTATTPTHLAEDGTETEEHDGRVTFGWIIDGWAMQDVWSGGGSIGTSIRWFEPTAREWTVMWLAPKANVIATVRAVR
jgi:hypothetical protein